MVARRCASMSVQEVAIPASTATSALIEPEPSASLPRPVISNVAGIASTSTASGASMLTMGPGATTTGPSVPSSGVSSRRAVRPIGPRFQPLHATPPASRNANSAYRLRGIAATNVARGSARACWPSRPMISAPQALNGISTQTGAEVESAR